MRHIVLFSLLALSGCSNETQRSESTIPAGVIPADSMAIYMADIQVLEAAIRSREVRKQKLQDEARLAYINYFDTASVSKDRFLKSLDYWKHDFGMMASIYDRAMETLSTRMAKQKKLEESAKED